MKKALFVLIIVLTLSFALTTAPADEPLSLRDFVEQVLVPMAKANDYEWRIVQEFSNEELGALIEACEANGIALPEDSYLMERYRDGETYGEESAISDVCNTVFGVDFWEWRIADRKWLREVMEGIGYDDWGQEEFPGPDDLSEDEARTVLFAALHDKFGEDIPFEDSEKFIIYLFYEPDQELYGEGWTWVIECNSRKDNLRYIAFIDNAGNNPYAYNTWKHQENTMHEPPLEAYSLTEEEVIHRAAEAIRDETGVDAPLEDPKVYSVSAMWRKDYKQGLLYWDAYFSSQTRQWGDCKVTVGDTTGRIRVDQTDLGPITVDNILDRYQNEYRFWGNWSLETWAQLSEEKAGLPAETLEGRILSSTEYILPQESLLTQIQADEAAFRAAGLTRAEIYCVVLIDADPHPVWKFCLMTQHDSYVDDFTLIEVDAVTGDILYLGSWLDDEDASCRVYSLNSTWAKLTLEEEGPLPLAKLAVIKTYEDGPYFVQNYIDDERFWKPVIRGRTVTFVSQKVGCPDFEVTLNQNGIPELIMTSAMKDGIQYAQVDLGNCDFSMVEFPVDLSDVVNQEDILSFESWENMIQTGETILKRCQEKGWAKDKALLSVTQYRPEHIWVFEYGIKNDPDPDAYEVTIGDALYVAIDSQSRTIVQAWAEE